MSPNTVSWLLILVIQSALLAHHGVLCINLNVTAVFGFGDSSIDPGNNNWITTLARANFPPYGIDFPGGIATGRFTNGRNAVDLLSEAFGLKPIVPAYLDPNLTLEEFSTGVNFASSGAGFDDDTSSKLGAIPMMKQLENFEKLKFDLDSKYGVEKSRNIISKAVYLIICGTNDFVENYYIDIRVPLKFSIEDYQNKRLLPFTEAFFVKLHRLGARNICLSGISPMGCMPLERTLNIDFLFGRFCKTGYNEVAKKYNVKLNGLLQKLNNTLTGATFVFADPHALLEDIYQHPKKYGFDNIDRGCVGTGLVEMGKLCENMPVCKDRSKFFFFDCFHPTERGNKIVVDYLLNSTFPSFLMP